MGDPPGFTTLRFGHKPPRDDIWLCHVVDLDFLAWASLSDQSGDYGLTKVQCERVSFGGSSGHSVTWWRYMWRGLRILEKILLP